MLVINDKSQGSVAAHLRCVVLFCYHFTMHLSLRLVVKTKLKLVDTWRNYREKVDCLMHPVLCLNIKNWPDNLPMKNVSNFCSCYVNTHINFDFSINNCQN